ncbi:MAG TPA: hypothetical protein VGM92_01870 [Candidatus Kapabacteria bacterium]|jgi:hypothetical protein
MKTLKNLLGALAISAMALMPVVGHAQSRVYLYHHGHRVNMIRSMNHRFSDIKSGVRYNTYKMSHRGRTTLTEQRQDARRESLYRARLNEQR